MRYTLYSALILLTGCAGLREIALTPDATGPSAVDQGLSEGIRVGLEGAASGLSTQDVVIGSVSTAAVTALTVMLRRYLKRRKGE